MRGWCAGPLVSWPEFSTWNTAFCPRLRKGAQMSDPKILSREEFSQALRYVNEGGMGYDLYLRG